MREPKPLTKERLLYITQTMELIDGFGKPSREPRADEMIRELLAAEQFWREAVKNMTPIVQIGTQMRCGICGGISDNPESFKTIHSPDCPWLLARK